MELNEVKGLGLTTEKYLNELGIFNLEDLINYFPFRYEIIENTDMSKVVDGDKVVVGGICEQAPSVFHFNKKLNKMTFRLNTGDFIAKVEIYNRAFLKQKITVGTPVTVIGKYNQKKSLITASDIKLKLIDEVVIEPVYHSSFNISSSKISKIMLKALETAEIKETMPEKIIEKYKFISKEEAVKIAHNPKSKLELKRALNRLKYEELFTFMLKINYLKKH